MSAETIATDAPKNKSFITRVMEDAAAKKAAKESGETVEPTSEEIATKRFLKKMAVVTAGVVAAGTVVIVLANRKLKDLETEADEETVTKD